MSMEGDKKEDEKGEARSTSLTERISSFFSVVNPFNRNSDQKSPERSPSTGLIAIPFTKDSKPDGDKGDKADKEQPEIVSSGSSPKTESKETKTPQKKHFKGVKEPGSAKKSTSTEKVGETKSLYNLRSKGQVIKVPVNSAPPTRSETAEAKIAKTKEMEKERVRAKSGTSIRVLSTDRKTGKRSIHSFEPVRDINYDSEQSILYVQKKEKLPSPKPIKKVSSKDSLRNVSADRRYGSHVIKSGSKESVKSQVVDKRYGPRTVHRTDSKDSIRSRSVNRKTSPKSVKKSGSKESVKGKPSEGKQGAKVVEQSNVTKSRSKESVKEAAKATSPEKRFGSKAIAKSASKEKLNAAFQDKKLSSQPVTQSSSREKVSSGSPDRRWGSKPVGQSGSREKIANASPDRRWGLKPVPAVPSGSKEKVNTVSNDRRWGPKPVPAAQSGSKEKVTTAASERRWGIKPVPIGKSGSKEKLSTPPTDKRYTPKTVAQSGSKEKLTTAPAERRWGPKAVPATQSGSKEKVGTPSTDKRFGPKAVTQSGSKEKMGNATPEKRPTPKLAVRSASKEKLNAAAADKKFVSKSGSKEKVSTASPDKRWGQKTAVGQSSSKEELKPKAVEKSSSKEKLANLSAERKIVQKPVRQSSSRDSLTSSSKDRLHRQRVARKSSSKGSVKSYVVDKRYGPKAVNRSGSRESVKIKSPAIDKRYGPRTVNRSDSRHSVRNRSADRKRSVSKSGSKDSLRSKSTQRKWTPKAALKSASKESLSRLVSSMERKQSPQRLGEARSEGPYGDTDDIYTRGPEKKNSQVFMAGKKEHEKEATSTFKAVKKADPSPATSDVKNAKKNSSKSHLMKASPRIPQMTSAIKNDQTSEESSDEEDISDFSVGPEGRTSKDKLSAPLSPTFLPTRLPFTNDSNNSGSMRLVSGDDNSNNDVKGKKLSKTSGRSPPRLSPTRSSPSRASPARTSTRASPARTSARASPARTSPVRASPAKSSPRKTSPGRRSPSKTKSPSRTSPTRSLPSRSSPTKTSPSRSSPSRNSWQMESRSPELGSVGRMAVGRMSWSPQRVWSRILDRNTSWNPETVSPPRGSGEEASWKPKKSSAASKLEEVASKPEVLPPKDGDEAAAGATAAVATAAATTTTAGAAATTTTTTTTAAAAADPEKPLLPDADKEGTTVEKKVPIKNLGYKTGWTPRKTSPNARFTDQLEFPDAGDVGTPVDEEVDQVLKNAAGKPAVETGERDLKKVTKSINEVNDASPQRASPRNVKEATYRSPNKSSPKNYVGDRSYQSPNKSPSKNVSEATAVPKRMPERRVPSAIRISSLPGTETSNPSPKKSKSKTKNKYTVKATPKVSSPRPTNEVTAANAKTAPSKNAYERPKPPTEKSPPSYFYMNETTTNPSPQRSPSNRKNDVGSRSPRRTPSRTGRNSSGKRTPSRKRTPPRFGYGAKKSNSAVRKKITSVIYIPKNELSPDAKKKDKQKNESPLDIKYRKLNESKIVIFSNRGRSETRSFTTKSVVHEMSNVAMLEAAAAAAIVPDKDADNDQDDHDNPLSTLPIFPTLLPSMDKPPSPPTPEREPSPPQPDPYELAELRKKSPEDIFYPFKFMYASERNKSPKDERNISPFSVRVKTNSPPPIFEQSLQNQSKSPVYSIRIQSKSPTPNKSKSYNKNTGPRYKTMGKSKSSTKSKSPVYRSTPKSSPVLKPTFLPTLPGVAGAASGQGGPPPGASTIQDSFNNSPFASSIPETFEARAEKEWKSVTHRPMPRFTVSSKTGTMVVKHTD